MVECLVCKKCKTTFYDYEKDDNGTECPSCGASDLKIASKDEEKYFLAHYYEIVVDDK